MLTFEKVLEIFADYLAADETIEVCSAWRGCAAYLFSAERCDSAGHGIFD